MRECALGLLLLAACGETATPIDAATDAAIGGPDTSIGCGQWSSCNPVSQVGCCPGDKCAFILDGPPGGPGHVGCVADGPVELGGTCIPPTEPGKSDDCAAGGECYLGTCHEICTSVNDQCTDGSCTRFHDDIGNPHPTEICFPSCDPLAQDCPDGQGCYFGREPICTSEGILQLDEPCGNINDCAPGLVCLVVDSTGPKCRRLCGPWAECFDGEVATACGCGSTVVCASDEVCVPISDGTGGVLDDTAGMCVTATDLGCDCAGDPICSPG